MSQMVINGNVSSEVDDLPEDEHSLSAAKLLLRCNVGSSKNYVLKSSTLGEKCAIALSSNFVKIYDTHGNLIDEHEHAKTVTDVKLSSSNNILYTSSLDGKIRVFDGRCQGPVQVFCDDSDGQLKPILCFDYDSFDSKIICAGTEVIREDSFLLFWDHRTSKILGGYWDSHSGDITQVHFHPQKSTWLASSSIDGLINVFDLEEQSEADALIKTINVEAPANTFSWKSDVLDSGEFGNLLSCITSIEEFHVLDLESVHPLFSTSRQKLYDDFQVKVDFMIDSLSNQNNYFLATGKNMGTVYLWNIDKNCKSMSSAGYILKGHSDAVRTINFTSEDSRILTGGDDGCICFWKIN